ncbi:mast cell protease 1A [Procambarus clarkii]|uniref:mast cell protease 1A n=1 Tax=Procambarus clarkii TaxID=6728 RepID=UPI001E677966|nr:mast cell protease 1A-like [Procambarus clarkii]
MTTNYAKFPDKRAYPRYIVRPFCDGCGVAQISQPRIVGGTQARPQEYPWLIFIHIKSNGQSLGCGGCLITRDFVLTAAHCLTGDGIEVSVYPGAHAFPNTNSTGIKVSQIIPHEHYDNYLRVHDIALLKLEQPVKFSSAVSPACLGVHQDVYVGKKVVVAGWGKLGENESLPSTLMEVQLSLVSGKMCKTKFKGSLNITENMLCSFTNGKDTCVGDSGGPLVTKVGVNQWATVGVVSFGAGCAEDFPGVYTRVSNYHRWIASHIKKPQC